MSEYLINVGEFNIIVLPDERHYFILDESVASLETQNRFIAGRTIDYGSLKPHWFQYGKEEFWKDFDGRTHQLGVDLSENDLIDTYVLKKFNFGSLVAVREGAGGKVRLFKPDMLERCEMSGPAAQ